MPDIKTIFTHLLHGKFMARRHGNRHRYAVYDSIANPIYSVSDANYRKLAPLIKTDKKGRITLNLTKVRQLHGNEWLKKEYKSSKLKDPSNAISK